MKVLNTVKVSWNTLIRLYIIRLLFANPASSLLVYQARPSFTARRSLCVCPALVTVPVILIWTINKLHLIVKRWTQGPAAYQPSSLVYRRVQAPQCVLNHWATLHTCMYNNLTYINHTYEPIKLIAEVFEIRSVTARSKHMSQLCNMFPWRYCDMLRVGCP